MSTGKEMVLHLKNKLAKYLDIKHVTVFRCINTLKTKGLLIQHKTKSNHLAPGKEFVDMVYNPETKGIAMFNDSRAFMSYIQYGVIPPPKIVYKEGCY